MNFKIGLKDKENFIDTLSTFLSSGVSIDLALSEIFKNTQNKYLKRKVQVIQEEIEKGKSVYTSFIKCKILDSQSLTLIKIGEEVGRLDYFLKVLSKSISRRDLLNTKIKSALIYPTFVLTTSTIVTIFIISYLFPKIIKLYNELNVNLPVTLKVFTYATRIDSFYFYLISFASLSILLLSLYLIFFNNRTKVVGELILIKLPQTSQIIKTAEQANTSLYISEMLKAGLNIYDIFKLIEENSNFILFKKFYNSVLLKIANGNTIEQAFSTSKFNPFSHSQNSIIFSAEKTGNLETIFSKVGKKALLDLKNKTNNLYSMLEPTLLIFIFFIVLGISVSVIYPLYNLFGNITSSNYSKGNSPTIDSSTINPTIIISPTKEAPLLDYVEILNTPTGYLNVRVDPNQNSQIIFKARPNEKYILLESSNPDWYKIKFDYNSSYSTGFINKAYAKILDTK